MFKKTLLKTTALTAALVCMFLLTACGGDTTKADTEKAANQTTVETEAETERNTAALTTADTEAEPIETIPASSETVKETEPEPTETTPPAPKSEIAKINGGADDVGIYSVVVRLTDQAADKGVIEMVYCGSKDSPQENSIVNTFRIEYYKETSGTFEISTFFNGEVYQNYHHKDEVKVTNTFDATLRAGNVTITYTPDGGETEEIFKADADYFRG